MVALNDPLEPLLGRSAAKLAEEFGISTVGQLLRHYPRRYVNLGAPLGEAQVEAGEHVTVVGEVARADLVRMKSRSGQFLKVTVASGRQTVEASFFHPERLRGIFKPGARMMFSGTVSYFRGKVQLTHPSFVELDSNARRGAVRGSGQLADLARAAQSGVGPGGDGGVLDDGLGRDLLPIYASTRHLQSWEVFSCVRIVLDQLGAVADPLPAPWLAERGLAPLGEALRLVHLPETEADCRRAEERLRFDEALAVQLTLARRKHDESLWQSPAMAPRAGGLAAAFDTQLPFALTAGQVAAGAELSGRLARPHPMNVLLQGEVGSGKTIVALRAMLQAVDAGYQCAILAPTEVLANQHHRSMRAMLGPLGAAGELGGADHGTQVALLTGSMGVAARRAALLKVVSGQAGIVVGTHALLQQKVEFFNLGLVVVDEQHRFGVEQRDSLRGKARDGVAPHVLVMTATPIPRTIAMTVFGALDVVTLRELPRGRSPVTSKVLPLSTQRKWLYRVWERVAEEVAHGRQAYVVCSRIGEDAAPGDDADPAQGAPPPEDGAAPPTTPVLEMFEQLRAGPLAHVRVGLLHGRLPTEEKDSVMAAFTAGEVDVLVCTTVVEVGVDVPNATAMVIVDADRFGVSQLHQLRGRVGRGAHPGLCILVSEATGAQATERLNAVAATNDGFALAELDLRQRREGDILGSAQSGTRTTLRLLSLLKHGDTIEAARRYAQAVIADDPTLAGHPGLDGLASSALGGARANYLEMA